MRRPSLILVLSVLASAIALQAEAAPVGPPGSIRTDLVSGTQPTATLEGPLPDPLPTYNGSHPCVTHTFTIVFESGPNEVGTGCAVSEGGNYSYSDYVTVAGTDAIVESLAVIVRPITGAWIGLSCSGFPDGCWLGTTSDPQIVTAPIPSRGGRVGPLAKINDFNGFRYANGDPLVVETSSVAASSNGEWLSVKTRGRNTLTRVDMTTRDVLPFAAAVPCCQGFSDIAPLAIDPSGQFVAQGKIDWGSNPLTIWDIAPCEAPPADGSSLATNCGSLPVTTLVGRPDFTPDRTFFMSWQEGSLRFGARFSTGTSTMWRMNAEPDSALTLSASPSSQTAGESVTLFAAGAGAPGTLVRFQVTDGPDAGFTAIIAADANGDASTNLQGQDTGLDTIFAWLDGNSNGLIDPGEPWDIAEVIWNPGIGPILLVHGLDGVGPAGNDCAAEWDDAKQYLRTHGFADRDLFTVAYYEYDANCDRSINSHTNPALGNSYFDGTGAHAGTAEGHTAEAAIEHLAYHFAWFIYDEYSSHGQKVDILAHSMGGLISRYALAEVDNDAGEFPPKLLIGNVVTLGTPHGGARQGGLGLCALKGGLRQCSQMKAGSEFLTSLQANGWNPQGDGGTDWTSMGSDDDNLVAADRSVGTSKDKQQNLYFGGCHKIWYPAARTVGTGRNQQVIKQPIEHEDYMHNGTIAGGMGATDLATYSSASHCGAPLVTLTAQRHPMGQAALALSSVDF